MADIPEQKDIPEQEAMQKFLAEPELTGPLEPQQSKATKDPIVVTITKCDTDFEVEGQPPTKDEKNLASYQTYLSRHALLPETEPPNNSAEQNGDDDEEQNGNEKEKQKGNEKEQKKEKETVSITQKECVKFAEAAAKAAAAKEAATKEDEAKEAVLEEAEAMVPSKDSVEEHPVSPISHEEAIDKLSWKQIICKIRKISELNDDSDARPWDNGSGKILPTLYYEDDGGNRTFTKKRIYFLEGMTLGDFKDKLRLNLRSMAANSVPLKLRYVEVIPQVLGLDVCICNICGNQSPTTLPDYESKKDSNQHLNVHTMEKFYGNDDVEDNVCRECAYFSNLRINIGRDRTQQTQSQPYLLMTGFFLSPAFWVMLALPVDLPFMMLLSVGAIILSTIVGFGLMYWGYGMSQKEIEIPIEEEPEEEMPERVFAHDKPLAAYERNRSLSRFAMGSATKFTNGFTSISNTVARKTERLRGPVAGTRIENWFKDPYNLVYKRHLYYVIGSLIMLNMINVFELLWLYDRTGRGSFNAAYECTWADHGDSIDTDCVVYFELVGSSASVLLSMLFINVAVIRRPKKQVTGRKKFVKDRDHSLLSLIEMANQADDDGVHGVKQYFMSAIDVIEEVRESEAPAYMPNSFKQIKWPGCCPCFKDKCCTRSLCCMGGWCWIPAPKLIVLYLMQIVFVCLLIGVSLYTHPEAYVDKMATDWGHIFPVIMGHAISVWFIYMCCMVMFKVTMIFRKSYALMQISSNPLYLIGKEVPRPVIDKLYRQYLKSKVEERSDHNSDSPTQSKLRVKTLQIVSEDLKKGGWDEFQKYCYDKDNIVVDLDVCVRVIRTPPKKLEIDEKDEKDIVQDERVDKYLDPKLKIVTPEFLRAWMALRNHIQKWELRYFFELTQPLVSLEIMFVLAALAYAVFNVLQEPYNGDMRLFFSESVAENNVLITLLLFLMLVIAFLLIHLDALLKPYKVQRAHEAWLMKVSMKLQIEHANRWEKASKQENITRNEDKAENEKRSSELSFFEAKQIELEEKKIKMDVRKVKLEAEEQSLSSLRELLSSMKERMSEKRAAPKLLGMLELNETLIQTISATISTALTGILLSFVTGVMTEIGENSGFYPTAEPTSAPTWEPTWWETTA